MKDKKLIRLFGYTRVFLNKFRKSFSKKQPIEIKKIKQLLIENGIKQGDILLVHSSLKSLMNSEARKNQDSKLSPFEYSSKLIDMLFSLVGDKGTILMPTEGIKNPLRFSYENKTFDYRFTPSLRGLITEIFRRKKNSFRSEMPLMNLTGAGRLAKKIIGDHKIAAPYLIGKNPLGKKFPNSLTQRYFYLVAILTLTLDQSARSSL